VPRQAAHEDRRVKLSDLAYQTLRMMIVEGELAPDTQLSEPELIERLGISRTPLREALLLLARDGLIAIYPQSGSFVTPIKLDGVEEAQFIREQLECGIIRRVVACIDGSGQARLRTLLLRQKIACDEGDPKQFHELDEALHTAFCEIAGRPGVWRSIDRSKIHLDRVRRRGLEIADKMPRVLRQHRAIVKAVMDADAEAAEAAMRVHLREVLKTVRVMNLGQAAKAAASPAGPRTRTKHSRTSTAMTEGSTDRGRDPSRLRATS
jgi:DNA-binding GntR family transcriptional regulator